LSQSFGDYEVLIGNDYVSDKLKLEDFDIVDDRFRITNHNENLGEISNMNWLLNNANGKYFTWLADDDVFHHDYLSIMHEIIGKSNAIALFSNYIAAPSIPSEFFNPISNLKWLKYDGNKFIENYVKRKLLLIGCYGLIDINILKQIGGMPSLGTKFGPYSDTVLPILLAEYGSIIYVNQPLQLLRTHPGSITASSSDIDEYISAEEDFLLILKSVCQDSMNWWHYNSLVYYMTCWFSDNHKGVLIRAPENGKLKSLFLFVYYQTSISYKRISSLFWLKFTSYLITTITKKLFFKSIQIYKKRIF